MLRFNYNSSLIRNFLSYRFVAKQVDYKVLETITCGCFMADGKELHNNKAIKKDELDVISYQTDRRFSNNLCCQCNDFLSFLH